MFFVRSHAALCKDFPRPPSPSYMETPFGGLDLASHMAAIQRLKVTSASIGSISLEPARHVARKQEQVQLGHHGIS